MELILHGGYKVISWMSNNLHVIYALCSQPKVNLHEMYANMCLDFSHQMKKFFFIHSALCKFYYAAVSIDNKAFLVKEILLK